jgi:hypothetical protein
MQRQQAMTTMDVIEIILEFAPCVNDVLTWRAVSRDWHRAATNTVAYIVGRVRDSAAEPETALLRRWYGWPARSPAKFGAVCLLDTANKIVLNSLRPLGGLRVLCNAPRLTSLNVEDTDVRDHDLAPLAKLQLRHINLDHCSFVSDFAALSRFSAMTHLNLAHTRVTSEQISYLGELQHLTELDLKGCEAIGDLSAIHAFSALRWLGLNDTLVDDASLATLESGSLEQLDVVNTRIRALSGFSPARLPRLQHLELSRTRVTCVAMPLLAKLPALATLLLDGCAEVFDVGCLGTAPKLRLLDLSRTNVPAYGLRGLVRSTSLQELVLTDRTPEY